MKLTILYRTIFEKILINKPFKYNIWILYIFLEINQGYFNHAKKILYRSFICINAQNYLIEKLFNFDKIFILGYVTLLHLKNQLHLTIFKNFIFRNFDLFWNSQKVDLFMYFLKNKFKNNFKSTELSNFFDIELKMGRVEKLISLFEKIFFDYKQFVSIKLSVILYKQMTNLVDKIGKFALLKNLVFISIKIKNKIYFFKIRKILMQNLILKHSLLKIKYKEKKLEFLANLSTRFLNSVLKLKSNLRKWISYISILKNTNNFLFKYSTKKNYFEAFKNSLNFFFSISTHNRNLNICFKPLKFFINIIILDQIFLIKNMLDYYLFLIQINKFLKTKNNFKFFFLKKNFQ